ncbi:hypothetical protein J7643_19790 [bacterium]|nr:hypothetical protein [bacterium]
MRLTKLHRALATTSAAIAFSVGCSQAPSTSPRPETPPISKEVSPQGGQPAPVVTEPCPQPPVPVVPQPPVLLETCRFVAFTARSFCSGMLFVYDDLEKDVYVLNGALAGLPFATVTPFQWQGVSAQCFGDRWVVFEFAGGIYAFDMIAQRRILLAPDGLCWGARPRISETGLLVYINLRGNVVLQQFGPAGFLEPVVPVTLTLLAAERDVQLGPDRYFWPDLPYFAPLCDVDITADGRWIVASLNGKLYLYDVLNPHLFQLLPLGGGGLGKAPGDIARVTISPDGRLIAFTVCGPKGERLLLLDRETGLIDTVPYANLGLNGPYTAVRNAKFFGGCLYFEVCTDVGTRVWRYNLDTSLINGMVILNNALGEIGTNVDI